MPEIIEVLEDLQVIHIESYGEVKDEDMKVTLDKVLEIRQDQGLKDVFVDATKQTSFPSTMPAYEFGTNMAEIVRGMRFALVLPQENRDNIIFLKTVVYNRGVQVEIFNSTNDALTWLTKKK